MQVLLLDGKSKEKSINVREEDLLDGVLRLEDGITFIGTLYATLGITKPYLFVEQMIDPSNMNIAWLEKAPCPPFISRSYLIDHCDLLSISAQFASVFTDRVKVENLFKCNCETGHKEPIGASCYYDIPLIQGFIPESDGISLVTVFKPVELMPYFHLKTCTVYSDNSIEYCRVELRHISDVRYIVNGLLDKRYIGEEMYREV